MKHTYLPWMLIPATAYAHPHNLTNATTQATGNIITIPDGTTTATTVFLILATITISYTVLHNRRETQTTTTDPPVSGNHYLNHAHKHANNGAYRQALELYKAGIRRKHDKQHASRLYHKLKTLQALHTAHTNIPHSNTEGVKHALQEIRHHYQHVNDAAFQEYVQNEYETIRNKARHELIQATLHDNETTN